MKTILIDGFFMNNGSEQFINNDNNSAFEEVVERIGKHNVNRVKRGFIIPEIVTKTPQPDYPKEYLEKANDLYQEAILRAEKNRKNKQADLDKGYEKFKETFGEAFASVIKPSPVTIIPPVSYEFDGFWMKVNIDDDELNKGISELREKFRKIN